VKVTLAGITFTVHGLVFFLMDARNDYTTTDVVVVVVVVGVASSVSRVADG
jgi:ABC-type nitrate/sulfonate/bicarbonate transport system permease component